MTTNEQIETATILQMKAEMGVARELLTIALEHMPPSLFKHRVKAFLARTEPKHAAAD